MEKHKLDSLIKKAINESNDFYDSDAEFAKERIWNKVKTQKKVIPLFYRLLLVASILLLIFLSVTTFSNLQYKSSIEKLVETNNQLKLDKENLQSNKNLSLSSATEKIDTVYIEKKTSELKPIVTTKYITDTIYLKQIVYVEKNSDSKLNSSTEIASSSNSESKTNAIDTLTVRTITNSNFTDKEKEENSLIAEAMPNSNSESGLNKNITKSNTLESNKNLADENVESSFQKEILIKSNEAVKKKKSKRFKIKFGGSNSKLEKEAFSLSTKISN
jgi:hypothetical protein